MDKKLQEAYAKVVDLTFSGDSSVLKEVGLRLAQTDPVLFIELYNDLRNPVCFGEPDWVEIVRGLSKSNQKIQAIKETRAATGWGLKEAKDFVENLEGKTYEQAKDIASELNNKPCI